MTSTAKPKQMIRGLYKRGTIWYSRIAGADGKLIRKRLSSDKQTAVIILTEMRKNIELQRAGILPASVVGMNARLRDLRDQYFKHMRAGTHSERTIDAFFTAYRLVIENNGLIKASDITLEKVEQWAATRLAKGVRGQTINLYIGMIRTFLDWAKTNSLIAYNPLAPWTPVRRNEPQKRRGLQVEEVNAILRAERHPEWRLRWFIYFFTGLRATAGATVRWEWIDWIKQIIRLPVESNKGQQRLKIPIHPSLNAALLKYKEEIGNPESGQIFSSTNTQAIRRQFRAACQRAGINTEGVTLHSTRHTLATRVYETSGRNLKAVQEILGHANALTTMRYLHMTEAEQQEIIQGVIYDTAQEGESELMRPGIIQFPAARVFNGHDFTTVIS
ncbi:MAG: site-specific integrase [Planctomycetaceae bacterium]|nr:site-specific integrase [Planctomycetaceae bacterium]